MTRPNKSLLHVLAQRLTRSSPAPTCDQDFLSHSLIHLDVGEVDLTSHIHVLAMSVQISPASDDLCTGHAAAVESHSSSVIVRNDCTRRLWKSKCHVLIDPLDVVWATSWLDESQIRWSLAVWSTEAGHAQSLVRIDENLYRWLNFRPLRQTPSARRE